MSDDAALIQMAFRKAGSDDLFRIVENPEEAIQYLKGEENYANREQLPVPDFVLLDSSDAGGW